MLITSHADFITGLKYFFKCGEIYCLFVKYCNFNPKIEL